MRKGDVIVAKSYLSEDEIDTLNRLVVIFLETAELRVKERKDLTLDFWRKNVDTLLIFQNKPLLNGKGSVTNIQCEELANSVYNQFDCHRNHQQTLEADEDDLKFLDQIADDIKNN